MTEIKEKKPRKKKIQTKAPSFLEDHPDAKDALQLVINEFTQQAKKVVVEKGFSADVTVSFAFYKET